MPGTGSPKRRPQTPLVELSTFFRTHRLAVTNPSAFKDRSRFLFMPIAESCIGRRLVSAIADYREWTLEIISAIRAKTFQNYAESGASLFDGWSSCNYCNLITCTCIVIYGPCNCSASDVLAYRNHASFCLNCVDRLIRFKMLMKIEPIFPHGAY